MKIATVDIDASAASLTSLRLHQTPSYDGHRSLSRGQCHLMEWYVVFSQSSISCLLYTSPSPRDRTRSRMPSSA